ncbi:MAG: redoxin family protein [Streptosporangiales bacterium]|nr:redoxin family protein [Streptosporangiales bacterium]
MRPAAGRRTGAAAAALVLLAGCGPVSGGGAAPTTSASSRPVASSASASVRAAAKLERCPAVRAAPPGTKGPSLPAVRLPCLDTGPTVPLGGLRGPLVVNLWATWCDPCLEEMPLFQRLHAAAGERVRVLGVATKDRSPDAALQFAGEVDLRYPSVYDRDGAVLRTARAGTGLPVTLFVDRAGRVVHRKIGPYTAYDQLTTDVRDHLGVRP